MRPCVWVASLVFAGIMAGCGAPPGEAPAPTISIDPPAPPSATSVPPGPPAATSTPRPVPVFGTARSQPVNCRFGPGLIYKVISMLDAGQSARADGRDFANGWLYVHDPLNPGGFCWVSDSAIDIEGEASLLHVVDPPLVTVDKIVVSVEPARITVACDNFPQFALLVAEISTNGPGLVNWRWELSTGEITDPQILTFEQAETKVLQKSFVIYSPNDYWVRLHVNAPNEASDQANLIANCTP